jgi:hypothetical protein
LILLDLRPTPKNLEKNLSQCCDNFMDKLDNLLINKKVLIFINLNQK